MDKVDYDQNHAILLEFLGKERFEHEWMEGRAMTLKEAITYALKANGPA